MLKIIDDPLGKYQIHLIYCLCKFEVILPFHTEFISHLLNKIGGANNADVLYTSWVFLHKRFTFVLLSSLLLRCVSQNSFSANVLKMSEAWRWSPLLKGILVATLATTWTFSLVKWGWKTVKGSWPHIAALKSTAANYTCVLLEYFTLSRTQTHK